MRDARCAMCDVCGVLMGEEHVAKEGNGWFDRQQESVAPEYCDETMVPSMRKIWAKKKRNEMKRFFFFFKYNYRQYLKCSQSWVNTVDL